MKPVDQVLTALIALALVAVLVAKSSKTTDAISGAFGLLRDLVTQIMGPLNVAGGS